MGGTGILISLGEDSLIEPRVLVIMESSILKSHVFAVNLYVNMNEHMRLLL